MPSMAQLKRDHNAAVKDQQRFISYENGHREQLPGFEEAHAKTHETKRLIREKFLSNLKK